MNRNAHDLIVRQRTILNCEMMNRFVAFSANEPDPVFSTDPLSIGTIYSNGLHSFIPEQVSRKVILLDNRQYGFAGIVAKYHSCARNHSQSFRCSNPNQSVSVFSN